MLIPLCFLGFELYPDRFLCVWPSVHIAHLLPPALSPPNDSHAALGPRTPLVPKLELAPKRRTCPLCQLILREGWPQWTLFPTGHFLMLAYLSLKSLYQSLFSCPYLILKKKPFQFDFDMLADFWNLSTFPMPMDFVLKKVSPCSEKTLDVFLFDMTKDPWPKTIPWLKSFTSKKLY